MSEINAKIFNTEKSDYKITPLFLGDEPGLFDTVNKQYPKIWDLYKKMKSLDWDENEFDFSSCNKDFKMCSKSVYDMMIKTLAWQWEADSIASRSIVSIVAPFISSSELWAAWQRVSDNECLTGDHEVLTPKGWKKLDSLELGDKVAQWDYKTREISFVIPDDVISKDYVGKLYHFYDGVNNVSQITTPDHRMPVIYPYWTNENQPEFKLAKEVKYHGGNGLPTSGYIHATGQKLSAQERLYIAVQADGSLCSEKYNGRYSGQMHYRFTFSKQRKIDRLFYLCDQAGWTITELNTTRNIDDKRRSFIVYLPVNEYNQLAKTFDWFDLDQINYEWAVAFLDEIKYWDGNVTKTDRVRYTSTNKSCIDKVVALAHLTGQRGHVTVIPPRSNVLMPSGNYYNTKESYQVFISKKPYVVGNSIITSMFDFSGKVYCLTVPTSYFVVRHGNSVTITGNCVHSATYSEIVRCSFDDPRVVIDEILSVKESLSRLKTISSNMKKAYDVSHEVASGQLSRDNVRAYEAIFMFTVTMLCLERIQFMSSFAITFAIAETGLFLPIGKAVQKICQDEFEVHVALDKAILENEMKTERGKYAFGMCQHQIKTMIDEIVASEIAWTEYAFSEGRELVGLTKELLIEGIRWNAADVYRFFGFTVPYSVAFKNPLGYMEDWVNISLTQASPQEEKVGQYMLGAVVDTAGSKQFDVDF